MGSLPERPRYGERTLLEVIETKARDIPDTIYHIVPRDNDLANGFIEINWADCWRAINRAAWWLESRLGKSSSFETIAYIGPSDPRYHFICLGAVMVGYRTLLTSPRNSIPAQHSLLEATKCQIFLHASTRNVDAILENTSVKPLVVPELQEFLALDQVQSYPYNKTFEQAKNDPWLVLHTSGSTGMPKPIYWVNQHPCVNDTGHLKETCDGYVTYWHAMSKSRCYSAFPYFHVSLSPQCNLVNCIIIDIHRLLGSLLDYFIRYIGMSKSSSVLQIGCLMPVYSER
jgi:acyl-CoA synthetase (AMP-forming)/AMP-acid ligase II